MLCANNIRKWLLNNNLLINSSKTMILNISLSNFVFPDIIFDNLLITSSSKIKFLGIIVSCNLSQSDHVSYTCKSANYHLHNINIIRKYLSIKSTIRLIESLVLSRLDYGNIILIGAPIYILKKIKRVIRRCIQIIFNIPYSSRFSTSYYLHKLKWLGVSSRINYRFLCLIKKVIISGLPSYLSTLLPEKRTG